MIVTFDSEFITQLFVGNLGYVLLVTSMILTRMLLLRVFAMASGGVGVAYSFFWLNDPVGTFWEAAFGMVNVVQIGLITYRSRRAKFSDDERAFHRQLVPLLGPYELRALLRVATWRNAEPGTELTRRGEPVSHLMFLISGQARVLVEGKSVGTCSAGSLVGEISILRGGPATATVVAREPVRYLALERGALEKLMKSHSEIDQAINHCNQKNLEMKLVRMNKAAMRPALTTAASANCNQPSCLGHLVAMREVALRA